MLSTKYENRPGNPNDELHGDSPLHPIIGQLEYAADLQRDDTAPGKLGKLQAMLAETKTSDDDTVLLAGLLSISTNGRLPSLDLSPQRRRARTFEALVWQLVALARQQPVLMLVEDAHWADPSSRELFDLVIDHLAELTVLLVMTFRPEFQAPWTGRAGVSLVTLSRLDRHATAAMAAEVAARIMPPELIDRIVTQADGVPLFVEELTRAVLEANVSPTAGTPRLAVPDSLQASLLARLDRLPAAMPLAQIGAVIGRSFTYGLVSAVAELSEPEVRNGLEQLVGAGLVFERGVLPEASFTFKHALVQDAAYNSLLRGRRAALHARVVEALHAQEPTLVESRPDLLAHHCEQAGLIGQAAEYNMRAGQQSTLRGAFTEARSRYATALRLIVTLPEGSGKIDAELRALTGLNDAVMYDAGYASSERDRLAAREAELCASASNPLVFLRTFMN
jgi:predicted ATPase